jgi:hypothetical protein
MCGTLPGKGGGQVLWQNMCNRTPLGQEPLPPTPQVPGGSVTTIHHSKSKTWNPRFKGDTQPQCFTTRYRYRLPAKAKAGGRGAKANYVVAEIRTGAVVSFACAREGSYKVKGIVDAAAPNLPHVYTQYSEN